MSDVSDVWENDVCVWDCVCAFFYFPRLLYGVQRNGFGGGYCERAAATDTRKYRRVLLLLFSLFPLCLGPPVSRQHFADNNKYV